MSTDLPVRSQAFWDIQCVLRLQSLLQTSAQARMPSKQTRWKMAMKGLKYGAQLLLTNSPVKQTSPLPIGMSE